MSSQNGATYFDNIVLSNLEMIRRIGARQHVRYDELDDFVQSVIYDVYAGRERLRDLSRFPQWLAAIARNAAIDWNRRKLPDLMEELPDVPDRMSRPHERDNAQWDMLLAVIETLDPIDRDLLYSYYANDASYAELQARYALSYMAVGFRLHRARRQVRERLTAMRNTLAKPTARAGFAAAVVAGKVYAIGGYGGFRRGLTPSVEEFDPETNTWTRKADMPTPRRFFAASVVGDHIYAIGGTTDIGQPVVSTVEVYDPATDIWTKNADMPTARSRVGAAVANERIYVIGGVANEIRDALSTVEEYDPATDTWSKKTDLPLARGRVATAAVDGKVYAIGGFVPDRLISESIVEEYDPASDRWTRKADMPTPREGADAVVANGRIYVLGGWKDDTILTSQPLVAAVEEYDPKTDKWTRKSDLPSPRTYLAASVVGGKIRVFGGMAEPFGRALSEMEEYAKGFSNADTDEGDPRLHREENET